ncbi:MAG: peptidoglycan DD-metalloendopeptidase family protein [Desulfuromonadaceae bacterium]|nr:peptidoglycan DD-metalloendopeptidase family protein [Desulfuromonadaceae bacterium]
MIMRETPTRHTWLKVYSSTATICALSLLFLFIPRPAVFAADELKQNKQKLQQVQEEIGSTSKKIKEKKATERSALQHLDELNRNIKKNDSQLQHQSEVLERLKKEIAASQKKSDLYEVILQRTRQDVEKRLRALYTTGEIGALRLFFSDSSPAVIAENTEFLQRITLHDKALLLEYRKQVENLEAEHKKLEEQKNRYTSTLTQQKEQRQKLEATKREQAALINEIRRDSSMLENMLADLKERSRAMKELIDSLEQQQSRTFVPTGDSFASLKGTLNWPSSGALRSGFGVHKHKQFGSQVKTNGLEIVAMPGTPIKAIWQGKVLFSAPFKGYGNMLILDHGDKYYSLYAYAAELKYKTGDIVKTQETIATAGFEGADNYYFEIRHHGAPLNPTQWLAPRPY